ncbi:MAG: antibiotic biosynthesis monooxygenase [Sphingobacteriales bacterium]|nr:MAG: antibiotic biosynthesis monooxygenase [Sphingobacteriales bacterium]
MILRIVRMSFRPEETEGFLEMFSERKDLIRNFEGCTHLELWKDANDPDVYLTYSHWESEAHLDRYRYSDLFKETWALTKARFAGKPVAWSINKVMEVK